MGAWTSRIARTCSRSPGVGPDCLAFLNDMEIVAIGADTAAVEWNFPMDPAYTRKAYGGFQGLPLRGGIGVPINPVAIR